MLLMPVPSLLLVEVLMEVCSVDKLIAELMPMLPTQELASMLVPMMLNALELKEAIAWRTDFAFLAEMTPTVVPPTLGEEIRVEIPSVTLPLVCVVLDVPAKPAVVVALTLALPDKIVTRMVDALPVPLMPRVLPMTDLSLLEPTLFVTATVFALILTSAQPMPTTMLDAWPTLEGPTAKPTDPVRLALLMLIVVFSMAVTFLDNLDVLYLEPTLDSVVLAWSMLTVLPLPLTVVLMVVATIALLGLLETNAVPLMVEKSSNNLTVILFPRLASHFVSLTPTAKMTVLLIAI
jgi:hypothetical protein